MRPQRIGLCEQQPHGLHMNTMTTTRCKQQAGVLLLEALVAILIFSLGILSIIQLQAVSIKQSSGAQYRTLAVTQANDLIGQMWANNKSTATLQANFASNPAGPSYTQWLSSVQSSGLPNVSSDRNTLPQVTITPVPNTTPGGTIVNQVSVTLFWIAPGDSQKHQYAVTANLIQ